MATDLNITIPYGGGNAAVTTLSSHQATSYVWLGGSTGRMYLSVRFQSNPNMLITDVFETNDMRMADGRTVTSLAKQAQMVTHATYNGKVVLTKLNDTTALIKNIYSTMYAYMYVVEIDESNNHRVKYHYIGSVNGGDQNWSTTSGVTNLYSAQSYFSYQLKENKVVTFDANYTTSPYYFFTERTWDPVAKTLTSKVITTGRYNNSDHRDSERGLYGEYRYGDAARQYPTLSGNTQDYWSSTHNHNYGQWITPIVDRLGRIHFQLTSSTSSGTSNPENIRSTQTQNYTTVYDPAADNWSICYMDGKWANSFGQSNTTYSNENHFNVWLPLDTRRRDHEGYSWSQDTTKNELVAHSFITPGKNYMNVWSRDAETNATKVKYRNDDSGDNSDTGSEQRVIQAMWLDKDHFVVFYCNRFNNSYWRNNYNNGNSPSHNQDGGIRYKVIRYLDEFMADVVKYGHIDSQYGYGNISQIMHPFKKIDERTLISECFNHMVTLWVPNIVPVAANDLYTMEEDAVLTVSDTNLGVLVNDSDLDGDSLEVLSTLTVDPFAGSASINSDGSFTYTPNANFTGTDSFSYRVVDNAGGFADGIVYITVTPKADSPTVQSDVYSIPEDTTLSVADISLGVLANDLDVDGDTLTVDTTPVAPTQNGSLTLNSDGTFTYVPNSNFNGTDSFEYKVEDGTGNAESGTVTINVTSVNDTPISVADTYSVVEDTVLSVNAEAGVLANDTDVESGSLTIDPTPVQDVVNGSLVLSSDGSFTYTPSANYHGVELFTYEVIDADGGKSQQSATITVTPVNDAPVALSDAYTIDEDNTLEVVDLSLAIVANDSDVDGDTITVDTTPVQDVANGTLTLTSDGKFTYIPDPNFAGSDFFIYKVSDTSGEEAQARVDITVNQVNDTPQPGIVSYSTQEDTPLTVVDAGVGILKETTDIEGDTLTVNTTPVVDVSNGTLVLSEDGTFSYAPDQNFNGSDTFTYEVTDSAGNSASGVVNISVSSVNDDPVSGDRAFSVNENTTENAVPELTATDVDGTVTGYKLMATPNSGGTLVTPEGTWTIGHTIPATDAGSVLYTPASGFYGVETFDYVAVDNEGGESTGSVVTATVVEVTLAPSLTGAAASYTMTEGQDTIVTVVDSSGEDVTWSYAVTSGSLSEATVSAVDNVFTVSPGSVDESFTLTFTATGTAGADSMVSEFTYTAPVVVTESSYPLSSDLEGSQVLFLDPSVGTNSSWTNTASPTNPATTPLAFSVSGTSFENNGTKNIAYVMTGSSQIEATTQRSHTNYNNAENRLGSDYDGSAGSEYTVSMWLKTTSGAVDSGTYLHGMGLGGDTNDDGAVSTGISAGRVAWFHYDGSWYKKFTTTTVNDGEWHNVVWAYNNGSLNIYIDGVLDTTVPSAGYSAGYYIFDYIGTALSDSAFSGSFGALRVFAEELTAGEVESVFNVDAEQYGMTPIEEAPADPNTFAVTAQNGKYYIDGQEAPTLTLTRGETYTFNVDAAGHPLFFHDNSYWASGQYANELGSIHGVTGSRTETITYTVPANAPNTIWYNCGVHANMGGAFSIVD